MCNAMHSGKEGQEMVHHTHDRVREASGTETLPTDPASEEPDTTMHSPNHAREARETWIHSPVQGKEDSGIGTPDQGKGGLEIETRTPNHHGKEDFEIESQGLDHAKVVSGIETLSQDHEKADEMVAHIRVQDLRGLMEGAMHVDRPA
jgi:hypothetical protein